MVLGGLSSGMRTLRLDEGRHGIARSAEEAELDVPALIDPLAKLKLGVESIRDHLKRGRDGDSHRLPQAVFNAETHPGMRTLRKMEQLFTLIDHSGWQRAPVQRQMCANFMGSLCFLLFGAALPIYEKQIMAMLGVDVLKMSTLVITPRQFGKTTQESMFAAVCLFAIPRFQGAIFATGQRISGVTKKKFRMFVNLLLKKCPEMRFKVLKDSEEEFEMVNLDDDTDRRYFYCYPSSVAVSFGVCSSSPSSSHGGASP